MSDEKGAAEARFADHMRRIRGAREISIEDIHEKTRIAEPLIETFEDGNLSGHPTFNEVYLRSFVRSYAEVLGISPEDALAALDAALEGTYDRALVEKYLSGEQRDESGGESGRLRKEDADLPRLVEPFPGTEAVEEAEEAADDAVEPGFPDGFPRVTRLKKAGVQNLDDLRAVDDLQSLPGIGPAYAEEIRGALRSLEGDKSEEEDTGEATPSEKETSPASSTGEEGEQPDGDDGDASGDGRSQAPVTRSTHAGSFGESRSASGLASATPLGRSRLLLIGAVALLFVAGLGMWLLSGGSEESPTDPDPTPSTTAPADPPPDSAAQAEDPAAAPQTTAGPSEREPSPDPVLADTLHLTVRADSVLEPIQVQRDEDLRRPYWVNQGEQVVFPFTDQVVVEEEQDRISLFLEGHSLSMTPDTGDQMRIDRARAEAILDTVQAPAPEWTSSPDTIPVGPPPAEEADGDERPRTSQPD